MFISEINHALPPHAPQLRLKKASSPGEPFSRHWIRQQMASSPALGATASGSPQPGLEGKAARPQTRGNQGCLQVCTEEWVLPAVGQDSKKLGKCLLK